MAAEVGEVIMIWLCLCFMIVPLCAQQQEQFLQANNVYGAKQYADALKMYNELSNKGRAVWYNMGNCAYHINDYSNAIRYWAHATCGATWDEYCDIQHNFNSVCKSLKISNKNIQSFYLSWYYWFVYRVPLLFLQLLFLCLWFLFCALFFCKKTGVRLTCMGMVLCMLLVIGFGLYAHYNVLNSAYVAVQTSVYNGPDKRYHVCGSLSCMQHVRVCTERDDWCYIVAPSCRGWIPADAVCVV